MSNRYGHNLFNINQSHKGARIEGKVNVVGVEDKSVFVPRTEKMMV